MKPRPPLPGGPYLVLGLARSGQAAALALRARGEQVIGCDSGQPDVERLRDAGVALRLGESGEAAVESARTLVKSPGIAPSAAAVVAARRLGREVIGELELAWRLLPNEFIAVTGTNGKTTTSELIGHIHRQAGQPVAVAGNVGTAAASLVGRLAPNATVVCEASSFQLEDTTAFSPEAALLLNLSEDHLDRHRDFERYVAAKLRIFAHQQRDDLAVVPCDLGRGLGIGSRRAGPRRVCFGPDEGAQLRVSAGELTWHEQPVLALDEIAMRGAHNRDNAMAAAAVTLARGLDPGTVRTALGSFPGVTHRLEDVAKRDGVLFVNDSKATNVASTLVALRSFRAGSVHLILGGDGKDRRFDALREEVDEAARAVYLIGRDAEAIAAALEGVRHPIERCEDLERAVNAAARAARPGETVLLSPGCASFDQYEDFEARGEHFRALARAL